MLLFLQTVGRIKKMSSHFCKNTQKKVKNFLKLGFLPLKEKGWLWENIQQAMVIGILVCSEN